jgi:hypothetical protein
MKTILVLKMAVAIAAACLFSMGAQSKDVGSMTSMG